MVRNILQMLRPSRAALTKTMPVFGIMLAFGAIGFLLGRLGVSRTGAQDRLAAKSDANPAAPSEYKQRVVAYIHDNIPITREELGEFLIARFGAERLETLVSRRIIELRCKAHGIEVTDALVEDQFNQELKAMNLSRKDFVNGFLKRYNKSLYEWKEDVIRPKLMLARLVEPEINVTEEDLRKGYEGRYGPKVECRWIVLPDDKYKAQLWEKARQSEAEFTRIATTHNIPQLCASGGKAPPIHKHFGDPQVEKYAFNLAVGEVSPLIGLPDKTVVILKCDKHIPQDLTKRYEDERLLLMHEIKNLKLTVRINEVIAELRTKAAPKLLLRNEIRQDDLERDAVSEIRGQAAPPPKAVPNKVGG